MRRRVGCRCAGRSGNPLRRSRGGRGRRGRCLRPGASSAVRSSASRYIGARKPTTSSCSSGRRRCSQLVVAASVWPGSGSRPSSAMGERAAISTWFWRGAFNETARLSKPKSRSASLKRAWWSPSTNSVSTSTSRSSAAMAWITAGGIAFRPVRWFRFQAARWRVSCCVCGGMVVRPGEGVVARRYGGGKTRA